MSTSETRAAASDQRRSPPRARFNIEGIVGFILLGGVLVSMALIATGLIWRWARTGQPGFDYSISGMDLFEFIVHDIRQVAAEDIRPRLLVNLGIATLMLTPYARVLVSILYFALAERNWKYTLFTSVVFGVLTYSLFLR